MSRMLKDHFSMDWLNIGGRAELARRLALLIATALLLCACVTMSRELDRIVAKATESRPLVRGVGTLS
jgi:hypothetical protein